jgi:acetylornithine/succinyldiaminopimelate/putrescine aminotransferase
VILVEAAGEVGNMIIIVSKAVSTGWPIEATLHAQRRSIAWAHASTIASCLLLK